MKILAFESSCDETAVAVVEDGRRVLSDAIASQADMHALYGGVVPEIASRKHVEVIAALTEKALADANCTRQDIDAVAVTYAPGLIGAVLVGRLLQGNVLPAAAQAAAVFVADCLKATPDEADERLGVWLESVLPRLMQNPE